jgi:hypothetical protein
VRWLLQDKKYANRPDPLHGLNKFMGHALETIGEFNEVPAFLDAWI